ncbi:MAG TPA: hypothetical protein VJW75_09770, partial [Candidatus Eisenbacteria bacterium]|nr:hypothetical protein [Candidatus Eisenbacteria bacterium]
IVPDGRENEVATADTYFYIERRVEYPRYVCADCHSYGVAWYDPYYDNCSVFEIRIDATWARYAPLRSRVLRPRYYYTIRSTARSRYPNWKERWSSLDGRATLRSRFRVEGDTKQRTRRESIQKRTPPEFRELRRSRPGRLWQGRDEVLKRREERRPEGGRQRGGAVRERDDRSQGKGNAQERRDRVREQRERPRRDRDAEPRYEPRQDGRRGEGRRREEGRREEPRREDRGMREEQRRQEPRREESRRDERRREDREDNSRREEHRREDRGGRDRDESPRGRDRGR